jgi:hypothetical protein
MSDSAYRQKMLALVEACASSGLTQKQWCAQQGITMDKFQYWNRRYKAARHADHATGPAFIPITLPAASTQPIAELHCLYRNRMRRDA